MKFKLLIIDALFIINLILGTYVIGKEVHNTFFAPTHDVTTHYTVKDGETLWEICDKYYIVENNTECFNEYVYRNMDANGSNLHAGDIVKITNRLYE